ncbi:MAG: ATP-binding protein [Oscillospiraceae bacterium]|jgi:anti-sigma regulatory factor (Ser/Thr protein kinase)|nr:ATP-binding protein [Oscillospiraceae bacterium]
MKKIVVPAEKENLNKILELSHEVLSKIKNLEEKTILNIDLVIEEIFVNVACYAYPEKKDGTVTIMCSIEDETFIIEFIDKGVKFNPLENNEPDITLDAEKRKAGGLGIFLAKKLTDKIHYFYKNNENHLILEKNLKMT